MQKKKKNKGELFWGKRILFQIVPFCCEPGSREQWLEMREEEEEARLFSFTQLMVR